MMKNFVHAALLAMVGLIAACGDGHGGSEGATAGNGAQATGATAGAAAGNMASMPMPSAAKMAKGIGTVTALDKAAATITLAHGPIPEAGWPAMTMTFKAAPGVIDGVKPGDKVKFDLALSDGNGEVTAITKE